MRSHIERVWKAAPLPPAFHLALETGNWQRALSIYQRHPFHAPPADTFDLLKSIMHYTGVGVNDVKNRFNEKVRLSVILQRKAIEEVEWGVFWDGLNKGDGKTISAALLGAHIQEPSKQIAVAEACAVLLRNAGSKWYERLVESMPFAVVTRSNLVHVALSESRSDMAVEILRNVRLTKTDVMALWPLMTKFTWQQILQMISACPKNAVPYDVALLFILRNGCNLQFLSEQLEQARVLGDVDVVAPLLTYAVEIEDWNYVERAMAHLVDIGQITPTTCKAFEHMCALHSYKAVCHALMEHNVQMVHLTVENLEALKL